MIVVVDASTLIGAVLKPDSVPEQALLRVVGAHQMIVSDAVMAEYQTVLARPKFARAIPDERRTRLLALVELASTFVVPTEAVQDCRDPKDNIYLALAAAGHAEMLISSDTDLLVLHPWRSISIVRPATFLALS